MVDCIAKPTVPMPYRLPVSGAIGKLGPMSMQTLRRPAGASKTPVGAPKQELRWLATEIVALFAIFIVAFTGRDAFGDGVKLLLTILSVIAGLAGVGAGLLVAARAWGMNSGRIARFAIAGAMVFFGGYTVVHVLS